MPGFYRLVGLVPFASFCCLSVAFLCTLPLETCDDANILGSCAKILQLLFGDATKAFHPQD